LISQEKLEAVKHEHAPSEAVFVSGTCRARTRAQHSHGKCQTRSILVRHESTVLTRATRSDSRGTQLGHDFWVCGFVGSNPTWYY